MGMDYKYSGSASGLRFSKELCAVAEVFGGVKTNYLKDRKANVEHNTDKPKFIFPKGTNEILVKWFNNVYDDFTTEETFKVTEEFIKHPEIKDISEQIWEELLHCAYYEEPWDIN